MRLSNIHYIVIGLFLCAAVLLSGVTFHHAAAGGAKPPQTIYIKEIENKDKIPGIKVNFLVKGKPKQVWKWISNVNKFGLLFPAVRKVEKIKKVDKNTTLYKFYVETVLGTQVFNAWRKVNKKKLSIKWKRTEGDLTYYSGSWKIRASKKYKGWVDCTYANFVDAAWYIPYFKVKSTSRDNATDMVPVLRKLVAGKGK